MEPLVLIGLASVVMSGLTIALGVITPGIAQGRAVEEGLRSIARQPDESDTITRTLFVGLAMIESFAIYCFVVAMILLFFNPFWNYLTQGGQ